MPRCLLLLVGGAMLCTGCIVTVPQTPCPTCVPCSSAAVSPTKSPPAQLYVGATMVVIADMGLNMFTAPGTDQERVKTLPGGTVVEVLDGPQETGGYTWWQVRDETGETGWVAGTWLAPPTLPPAPDATPAPGARMNPYLLGTAGTVVDGDAEFTVQIVGQKSGDEAFEMVGDRMRELLERFDLEALVVQIHLVYVSGNEEYPRDFTGAHWRTETNHRLHSGIGAYQYTEEIHGEYFPGAEMTGYITFSIPEGTHPAGIAYMSRDGHMTWFALD